jgi:hypothetical protein
MVAAVLAPQPTRLPPGAGQPRAARRAALLPVAHGLVAMATILLALLTALGAA